MGVVTQRRASGQRQGHAGTSPLAFPVSVDGMAPEKLVAAATEAAAASGYCDPQDLADPANQSLQVCGSLIAPHVTLI